MAGSIATLIANTRTLAADAVDRAEQRHARDELEALQSRGDPALASPYLKASAVSTIAANGGTSGNFTLTLNFPKYGVAVTTANIAFNAAQAAIRTAVNNALNGQTLISSYTANDVNVGACANMAAATCALTANGTSVNGAHMIVTTTNVNLDVAAPSVAATTIGTQNRPAEAILKHFSVVTPASTPTPQGMTPATGDYVLGGGKMRNSTRKILAAECRLEDKTIGDFIGALLGE